MEPINLCASSDEESTEIRVCSQRTADGSSSRGAVRSGGLQKVSNEKARSKRTGESSSHKRKLREVTPSPANNTTANTKITNFFDMTGDYVAPPPKSPLRPTNLRAQTSNESIPKKPVLNYRAKKSSCLLIDSSDDETQVASRKRHRLQQQRLDGFSRDNKKARFTSGGVNSRGPVWGSLGSNAKKDTGFPDDRGSLTKVSEKSPIATLGAATTTSPKRKKRMAHKTTGGYCFPKSKTNSKDSRPISVEQPSSGSAASIAFRNTSSGVAKAAAPRLSSYVPSVSGTKDRQTMTTDRETKPETTLKEKLSDSAAAPLPIENRTEAALGSVDLDMDPDAKEQLDEYFSKRQVKDGYTYEEYIELWKSAEKDVGITTERIEDGSLVRHANTKVDKSDTDHQGSAQYGRIMFPGIRKLFEIMGLTRNDRIVDLGHGIGNVPLQAAYTVGCLSRGLELVGDRFVVSQAFEDSLRRSNEVILGRYDIEHVVGKVELRKGALEDPEHRDFLISCNYAFVNNAAGVFKDRSKMKGNRNLDDFVAGLFCLMEKGSEMYTLSELPLSPSLKDVNKWRERNQLSQSPTGSFYTFEIVDLDGEQVVSWSNQTDIVTYKYTRVDQGTDKPYFLCSNPDCTVAQLAQPIPAVQHLDDRKIVSNCYCPECKWSPPERRVRTKTTHYGYTK